MKEKRGVFIVFEGIDGCGKSTQIKKFVEYLFNRDKHNHIVLTRNPYKDSDIRQIIREDDDPLSKSEKLAEVFIKDRELQAAETIIPNLEKGHFIVCDRYKLSTIAYQSAQGLDIKKLIEMQKHLPVPDITFIIDLSSNEASERMKNEEGRKGHKFETNLDFLEKTRMNFHRAKQLLPEEKIFIIFGNRDIEIIFDEIKNIFEKEVLDN